MNSAINAAVNNELGFSKTASYNGNNEAYGRCHLRLIQMSSLQSAKINCSSKPKTKPCIQCLLKHDSMISKLLLHSNLPTNNNNFTFSIF